MPKDKEYYGEKLLGVHNGGATKSNVEILAGVTGQKIVITSLLLNMAQNTTVSLTDGTGTDYVPDNFIFYQPVALQDIRWECAAGEGLNWNVTTAVNVSLLVGYHFEDVAPT